MVAHVGLRVVRVVRRWHHMVNAAFHVANTVLLFRVLQRMTGAWKRSALVAAFFALHPLHVESVAWGGGTEGRLEHVFVFAGTRGLCSIRRGDWNAKIQGRSFLPADPFIFSSLVLRQNRCW